MAGSHEVRGSIPLGSTTDPRGARRRRRAPLFCLGTEKKARGARLLLGVAAGRLALARLPWSLLVSFGGVGAGRRPFLVRPDSPAHLSARAESAPPPRMGIARPVRSRPPARARGGRAGPARAHRGDPRQGGDAFGGSGFANPGIDGLPEALDVRRPLSRKGDPCDDAAIEPANRAPKKGLAYRRASAGLGRLRREPDPCVRRRSGAGTHSARGCMGPAEFGNAGLPPWKTLSWPSRIRRRLGRALLPGDLGGAVAVGAAAPDL